MANATYPSLKDKVVFITGGASGIGASFVRSFRDQGAKVAFVDLKAEDGQALRKALGEGVWFKACDVTDAAALQDAVRAAGEALGPVTILINNVANDTRSAAMDTSPEAWREGLAVNLDPVFLASTAAYPMMKRAGGGAIVNLSSITAIQGPALLSAYVAAKGAIVAMTKSLAREWGADHVRVNAILPGWVVTERQLELWMTPEAEAAWMKETALPDRLYPDDIARLALFLASDEARMITGQAFVIDGGHA
jgi:NAD(P)-dependent dehydrogenase (short-subunit alcohol dehydrogenase family)